MTFSNMYFYPTVIRSLDGQKTILIVTKDKQSGTSVKTFSAMFQVKFEPFHVEFTKYMFAHF